MAIIVMLFARDPFRIAHFETAGLATRVEAIFMSTAPVKQQLSVRVDLSRPVKLIRCTSNVVAYSNLHIVKPCEVTYHALTVMERLARIAMVCEGDAESPDQAFSGLANSILVHLRNLGHEVHTINTKLTGGARVRAALRSYTYDRGKWRARFRYGSASALARSRKAQRAFTAVSDRVDIIVQIGATSTPPGNGRTPYTLYCDWNFSLSIKNRANRYSTIHGMPDNEAQRINARESITYARAAAIFTISERLRRSFIDDYGMEPRRVLTVHAGPNIEISRLLAMDWSQRDSKPPTILFVGKEFERKGGDILLAAFGAVRKNLPDARLVIIGPTEMRDSHEGVNFLGPLRKDDPSEFERLLEEYQAAHVFCLPSRQEPLGTVVLEAMFSGLPCVTSNIWAMPEMIVDGQTGFTVNPNDSHALADRLYRLLTDRAMARDMGEAGRLHAQSRYTWQAAVMAMHGRIQTIVGLQNSTS